MNIFVAIISFLGALPKFVSMFMDLYSAWKKAQQDQEDNRIDQAATHMKDAKTDEDRIKAAREAAEAVRHL